MAKPGRKKKVITEEEILEYDQLKSHSGEYKDGVTYAPCDICEHYQTCESECYHFLKYVSLHNKTGRHVNYNDFKRKNNISDEEEKIRKEKSYRMMFE